MNTIYRQVLPAKRSLEVRQHMVLPEYPDPVVAKKASDRGRVLPRAEGASGPPLLIVQPQISLASLVGALGVVIPRGHPPGEDSINWLEILSLKKR